MEKEHIIIQMEKLNIKVILLIINMKEMENIFGKMVNIIQVNLKIIYQMVKVLNIIKMEIYYMMVFGLMVSQKEMENLLEKMVDIIQDNLKMD